MSNLLISSKDEQDVARDQTLAQELNKGKNKETPDQIIVYIKRIKNLPELLESQKTKSSPKKNK